MFKRKKPGYLTEKEFTCLELFLKYGNKTRAGVEAGYAKKSAAQQASRIINSKKGQKYIDDRLYEEDSKKIASANEVMEYLTRVMRGEEKDQFDLEISIAERTKAAQELAKRIVDNNTSADIHVKIVDNIPTTVNIKKSGGEEAEQ